MSDDGKGSQEHRGSVNEIERQGRNFDSESDDRDATRQPKDWTLVRTCSHFLAYGDDADGRSCDGELHVEVSQVMTLHIDDEALRAVLRVIIDGDDWMLASKIREKSRCPKTMAVIDVLYWEKRALVRTKKGKRFVYRAGSRAAQLLKELERQ